MYKFQLSFLVVLLITTLSYGQGDLALKPGQARSHYFVEASEGACELNSSYLDILRNKAGERSARITIVSRLGNREDNALHEVRLNNARQELLVGGGFQGTRVVTRTGRKLRSGFGRVEFFLNEKLFLVSEAEFNRSPCWSCCEDVSATPEPGSVDQTNSQRITVVESLGGSTCESATADLDSFVQATSPEKSVLIISYRGRSERRKGVELQRLRIAANFLRSRLHFGSDSDAQSLVAALADEQADKGKLDLYVDGIIGFRIDFRQNAYLALSPCHESYKLKP